MPMQIIAMPSADRAKLFNGIAEFDPSCLKCTRYYKAFDSFMDIFLGEMGQEYKLYIAELSLLFNNYIRAIRANKNMTVKFEYNIPEYSSKRTVMPQNKRRFIVRSRLHKLLDILENNEYIMAYKGFLNPAEKTGSYSVIQFLKKFDACVLDKTVFGVSTDKVPPAIVKHRRSSLSRIVGVDDNNKEKKREFKGELSHLNKRKLKKGVDVVDNLNLTLSSHKINISGSEVSDLEYFRVYHIKDIMKDGSPLQFMGGGRIYSKCSFQNTKSEERKTILIDGEQTVEIDFKNNHPAMMAEVLGFNLDYDAYTIDIHEDLSMSKEDLRVVCKKSFQALMYSKTIHGAVLSTSNTLIELGHFEDIKMSFVAAKYIIESLVDKNKMFKSQFVKPTNWVEWQGFDGDILDRVINKFTAANKAVLPYHDSYVVKKSDEQFLLDAMLEAWTEVFGCANNMKTSIDYGMSPEEVAALIASRNEKSPFRKMLDDLGHTKTPEELSLHVSVCNIIHNYELEAQGRTRSLHFITIRHRYLIPLIYAAIKNNEIQRSVDSLIETEELVARLTSHQDKEVVAITNEVVPFTDSKEVGSTTTINEDTSNISNESTQPTKETEKLDMAKKLPEIKNDLPTYKVNLLSIGEVEFKPFTVKEQKKLLMVSGGVDGDPIEIVKSLKDCIKSCTVQKINVDALPYFDIIMLFLALRSQSVGSLLDLNYTCEHEVEVTNEDGSVSKKPCGHNVKFNINLSDITYKIPEGHSTLIQLSDNIGVKMRYPSVFDIARVKKFDYIEHFDFIATCIEVIYSDDEIFKISDIPFPERRKELSNFLDSLSVEQITKIDNFFGTSPSIQYKKEVTCPKCKDKKVIVLDSISDFF